MKHAVFALTLLAQFVSLGSLKLLDHFELLIGIHVFCLFAGGFLLLSGKADKTRIRWRIGWGMFYASLTTLSLLLVFMIWLCFSFPG